MTILLTDIEKALNREDIEGLLAAGAPADEYSAEAQSIYNVLMELNHSQISETQLTAILSKVWAKYFSRSIAELEKRVPAFKRIAQEIIQIGKKDY